MALIINQYTTWLFLILSTSWAVDINYEDSDIGYKMEEARTECESLNKTIIGVKCVSLFASRRRRYTAIIFNLLVQADELDLKAEYSKGSLRTNQYPGPAVKLNLSFCKMLKLNLWGSFTYTTTYGNLTLCPIKPGIYYATPMNASDDSHKHVPKNIPMGDYKHNVSVYINKVLAARIIDYISFIKL